MNFPFCRQPCLPATARQSRRPPCAKSSAMRRQFARRCAGAARSPRISSSPTCSSPGSTRRRPRRITRRSWRSSGTGSPAGAWKRPCRRSTSGVPNPLNTAPPTIARTRRRICCGLPMGAAGRNPSSWSAPCAPAAFPPVRSMCPGGHTVTTTTPGSRPGWTEHGAILAPVSRNPFWIPAGLPPPHPAPCWCIPKPGGSALRVTRSAARSSAPSSSTAQPPTRRRRS